MIILTYSDTRIQKHFRFEFIAHQITLRPRKASNPSRNVKFQSQLQFLVRMHNSYYIGVTGVYVYISVCNIFVVFLTNMFEPLQNFIYIVLFN
jgi:hypothetical protein